MEAAELARRFPKLFHMASASAWPSIQARGLLSTEQLLNLYEVEGPQRDEILLNKRASAVTLHHPGLPPVTVRDQKPMKFIEQKIAPGSSLLQYLAAINSRVFFWASRDRLNRLRDAREYRDHPQVVLHVDTARLLAAHGPQVELCRLNSGAVTQLNHPARGHLSWIRLEDYPYDDYRRRYGADRALTEVTVPGAVPDILGLLVDVEFPGST